MKTPTKMTSPLHIDTPLIESAPLSELTGSSVFLKVESLQPSGSFKNRGIGHFCSVKAAEGAKEFFCSSGGNAGLAAAYSAKKLGIPITVFVPETTPKMMLERIRREGATVVVEGKDWQEADQMTRRVCSEKKGCYISPFDDPLIWEGHSSMIHEIAEAGLQPDVVVVSVGGGGLFCGLAQGMEDVGWGSVPIFAVETEGAACFAAAYAKGEVVELERVETIASSLAARAVTAKAVEWIKHRPVVSKVVSDRFAVQACSHFAEDHRILSEPACGAPLSLLYEKDPDLLNFQKILVIICGGAAATPRQLLNWEKKVGLEYDQ